MVSGPENGAQTHFARTTREAVVHISGVRPLNQHEQLVAQHIGLMRAYGAAKFQQSLLNSFL